MQYITELLENCHFLIKWRWQRAHHTAALYTRLLFQLPAAVLKWMASSCEYCTLLSASRGVLCWLQWHHIVATLETNSCLLHLFTSECTDLQQTTILWIGIPLIENYWRKMASFANCIVIGMNLLTWLLYSSENLTFVHTLYLRTVRVLLQHLLNVISVHKTQ